MGSMLTQEGMRERQRVVRGPGKIRSRSFRGALNSKVVETRALSLVVGRCLDAVHPVHAHCIVVEQRRPVGLGQIAHQLGEGGVGIAEAHARGESAGSNNTRV